MSGKKLLVLVMLVVIGAGFVGHALSLSFTQDDSYITYRYVKNFLNGNGLVFNQGEYVEGYTNFLFVILLALSGIAGVNFIMVSKIIGVASGLAIIALSFVWSRRFLKYTRYDFLAFFVPVALAANPSFSYWAISGMETSLFSALLLYGLFLASERKPLFVPIMALATLTRPEGGLVFIIILIYLFVVRALHRKALVASVVMFALLMLPQLLFRISYYHDILPNTFYAKTGMAVGYLMGGMRYIWLFLRMYGFYGLIILLPPIAVKLLPRSMRFLLTINILFMIYIVMVGGDVLHEHRFFVPLFASFYLVFLAAIIQIGERFLKARLQVLPIILGAVLVAASAATYFVPKGEMAVSREAMNALVNKMKMIAESLNRDVWGYYSLSCSTIGAISYFGENDVIDMIGLTDRTIAKEPQPEIPGIESAWKERQYNVPYLMKRQPDFIVFSTGLKPTAPAEKALFLSSKFRNGYYPVLITSPPLTLYRLKPGFKGEDNYVTDPRFVNFFAQAINLYTGEQFDSAYVMARLSDSLAPADFYQAATLMGDIRTAQKRYQEALSDMRRAFEKSGGYSIEAAHVLSRLYKAGGDSAGFAFYRKIIDEKNRLK